MQAEKVLSIKQPWAWLICMGYKDIENRGWRIGRKPGYHDISFELKLPSRIYVHAGKQPDYSWGGEDLIKRILTVTQYNNYQILSAHFPLGAVIGEVDITACVKESDSPWFVGLYGFVLSHPIIYDNPIPCSGNLGFFLPDKTVLDQIEKMKNSFEVKT
jgi:hypothetical protein